MEFYGALNKYKDMNSSLEHKQNYKYYNKIDLGNGNTRYFYTKAEWDAYQDGKKSTPKVEVSKTTYLKNPNGDPVGVKSTINIINNDKVKEAIKDHQEKTKKEEAKKTVRNMLWNYTEDMYKKLQNSYSMFEDSLEKKFKDKDKATKDEAAQYRPHYYEGCVQYYWKDLGDVWEEERKNYNKQLDALEERYNNGEDVSKELNEVIKNYAQTVETRMEEEISKREKSLESYSNFYKAMNNKLGVIEDEIKEMSNYDKQVLADEMGLEEWSEKAILDKYGFNEDDIYDCDEEDYNASKFEKMTEQINDIWNDYKAAKKALS